MAARVRIIPVLSDNYSYLIIDDSNGVAAAVDPVDADRVLNAAREEKVTVTHILTTHGHSDHAGGNKDMVERLKGGVEVIGGKGDGVLAVTREVGQNDHVSVGRLNIQVLFTPCHTRGHVLYLVDGKLFTGDTLFVAGCGRFFVGTPEEMHRALNEVVASLPRSTEVYCGHEYTVTNLRFALRVEPDNEDIKDKLEWAKALRKQNKPTVPSTVDSELKTNPFMRVSVPAVKKYAGAEELVEVMATLRERKNGFK